MESDLEAKKAEFIKKKKEQLAAAKAQNEADEQAAQTQETAKAAEPALSQQEEIDKLMNGAATSDSSEELSEQDEIDRMMAAAAGLGEEDDTSDETEDELESLDDMLDDEPADDELEYSVEDLESEPDETTADILDELTPESSIPPPSAKEPVMNVSSIDIELPSASPQAIEEVLAALAAGELIDAEEDQEYLRQRKINGVVKKLETLIEQAVASIPPDTMSADDVSLAVRRTIGHLCEKYGLFG